MPHRADKSAKRLNELVAELKNLRADAMHTRTALDVMMDTVLVMAETTELEVSMTRDILTRLNKQGKVLNTLRLALENGGDE